MRSDEIADIWEELEAAWPPGTCVVGRVYRVAPYGAFVDLGVRFSGLAEYPDTKLQPDEPFEQGQEIRAAVILFHPGLGQIRLSPRRSMLPPDAVPVPTPARLQAVLAPINENIAVPDIVERFRDKRNQAND